MKTEAGASAEDLSSGRAQIIDDDDDEHDEHDDSDKINDAEGMDPERLKAFNVSGPFSPLWGLHSFKYVLECLRCLTRV